MKPGDRRKRWNESCGMSAFICFCIGGFFICAGITSTGNIGGIIGIGLFGAIMILMGIMDLADIKKGWKMRDERPPWADRHDAIDKKKGAIYRGGGKYY